MICLTSVFYTNITIISINLLVIYLIIFFFFNIYLDLEPHLRLLTLAREFKWKLYSTLPTIGITIRKPLSVTRSDLNSISWISLGRQYLAAQIYVIRSGLELARQLRARYWDEDLFTIFISGFDDSTYMFWDSKLRPFNVYKYNHFYHIYNNWGDYQLNFASYYYYYPDFSIEFDKGDVLNFSIESKGYTNSLESSAGVLWVYWGVVAAALKTLWLPLLSAFLFLFYLIVYFYINICRQLALWLVVGLLFFWLFSGFNFFLKRYRFGKFTSAILRFWKRTNVYFWLVEGFLFGLFFYYYLNSSQEPYYMYDYSGLSQTYLPNLVSVYCNTMFLILVIVYYYYWILNFTNFTSQQNIFHSTVITLYMLYTYLIESYQFYYILTFFFENIWVYNHESNLWVLEFESPRFRVKQQYLLLALIAKYWHFIFIFISWLFFVLKIFEQRRSYYTHSGFNIQNLIILFWLNFLFITQWFKWVGRRFLDSSYYWFFTDVNVSTLKFFLVELYYIFTCDVRHQV